MATGLKLIIRATHPAEVALALKNSKVEEDIRERPVSFEDEGVDVNQMSAISLMFDALSTERLNGSQIIFIADEEAKVRKYDIHPLLQSMLSISKIIKTFVLFTWSMNSSCPE